MTTLLYSIFVIDRCVQALLWEFCSQRCVLTVDLGLWVETIDNHLQILPVTNRIVQRANNRLGAVYSALYSFWSARHAANAISQQDAPARRDAYSIILFGESVSNVVTNDFESSADQLLDAVLEYQADECTDFTIALRSARTVMEQYFSAERYAQGAFENFPFAYDVDRTPVVIFLSDGECEISDQTMQEFCQSAVDLGSVILTSFQHTLP